jgi:UDP-glucose:(heptosyl)LPS alpha-1,3-glucosyltransferase
MKLSLIYHQFERRGGLENYLFEFIRHLLGRGHEVELVGARFAPEAEQLAASLRPIKSPPLSSTFRLWKFDRDAGALVSCLNADATIGFGRTTVQDLHRAGGGCHKVYSRRLSAFKRTGFKNRLELELEKRLYTGGLTKHFVVNSQNVFQQIREEYGVEEGRISVIHTAVDTSRFRPPRGTEDRVNIQSSGNGRAAFLFVSLDHKRKGLEPLIDAWQEVDADIWIIGAPLEGRHLRLVRERALESRIRYLGRVSDVAPYYRAADFYLHPSFYDACANSSLQAMASGLPSIVSSCDGASEFVSHGISGFVLRNPEDASEIHKVVMEALKLTPEQREAMGRESRSRMLPLTWQAHVEKWEALINRIRS